MEAVAQKPDIRAVPDNAETPVKKSDASGKYVFPLVLAGILIFALFLGWDSENVKNARLSIAKLITPVTTQTGIEAPARLMDNRPPVTMPQNVQKGQPSPNYVAPVKKKRLAKRKTSRIAMVRGGQRTVYIDGRRYVPSRR